MASSCWESQSYKPREINSANDHVSLKSLKTSDGMIGLDDTLILTQWNPEQRTQITEMTHENDLKWPMETHRE